MTAGKLRTEKADMRALDCAGLRERWVPPRGMRSSARRLQERGFLQCRHGVYFITEKGREALKGSGEKAK